MIDERILANITFTQTGGSCYFFSYYYVLSYYNALAHPSYKMAPKHVFAEFFAFLSSKGFLSIEDYHKELEEYGKTTDKSILLKFENHLNYLLLKYANTPPGKLSGYQVIYEFDTWLVNNKSKIRPNNFEIKRIVRCCELGKDDPPIFDDITSNIGQNHSLIMIGYPSTGKHSIIMFETMDRTKILFKDSNCKGLVKDITLFKYIGTPPPPDNPFTYDARCKDIGPMAKSVLSNSNHIGEYLITKLIRRN